MATARRRALPLLLAVCLASAIAEAKVETFDLAVKPGDAVQHQILGVNFRADPVFSQFTIEGDDPVAAFRVSLSYSEPAVGAPESWVTEQLIPNLPGQRRQYGPFTNRRGVHYRVIASVERSNDVSHVTFALESDNLELEAAYRENFSAPAFILHLGKIRYQGIWEFKAAWQVYTTVSFGYGVVRVAQGALAPEVFVVQVIVEWAVGEILSNIPDHYQGAVNYTCTFCGHRGDLEEIKSCRVLTCPHCKINSARICLRRIKSER